MIGDYVCIPLTSDKKHLLQLNSFVIDRESDVSMLSDKIIGLESYLKRCAWDDDLNNEVKIYLIKDNITDDIAAYFGLKAGMVVDNESSVPNFEVIKETLKNSNTKIVPSVVNIFVSGFSTGA